MYYTCITVEKNDFRQQKIICIIKTFRAINELITSAFGA